MKCRICGNEKENQTYEIREMMFGYKDSFRYFQCSKCKCLQIEEIPPNMSKYYPGNYYSYKAVYPRNKIKKFLSRQRDNYAMFGKGFFGKLLYTKYPREKEKFSSLSFLPVKKDTSILDVGCGNGSFLYSLLEIGMKNLLGVDPFVAEDIEYENGLRIEKKEIHEVEGKWDVVMFHHSFEHLSEPAKTLKTVYKLLKTNGFCVIRIPTVSSYAWKHYGVNWVQLDAPRHLFLHSVESMNFLAKQANLDLDKVVYDSTSFQFWGSEQYIKDIPLMDECSYAKHPESSIFTKKEISAFAQRAKELNKKGEGDQAIFYLKKS